MSEQIISCSFVVQVPDRASNRFHWAKANSSVNSTAPKRPNGLGLANGKFKTSNMPKNLPMDVK
jgi:hypothetical protein